MINTQNLSFEEVVLRCRKVPSLQELIRGAYLDEDLEAAAMRFLSSEEWAALKGLLPPNKSAILDLGAGRGIVSCALAREGWEVTALEPDPSSVVGADAIRELSSALNVQVNVVQQFATEAALPDVSYDAVYCRAVMHHIDDLPAVCREVCRVLKPGGIFIASREHVISTVDEQDAFLDSNPMHRMHSGEKALLRCDYESAMASAGFQITKVLGHYDSPINYHPMSMAEWASFCRQPLCEATCYKFGNLVASEKWAIGRTLLHYMARSASLRCRIPGRLYTWVCVKP